MSMHQGRTADILEQFRSVAGPDNVLSDAEDLLVYESDGLTFHRSVPDCVILPTSTGQIGPLVGIATRSGMPIVVRGSGTGLSGGAVACRGGLMIETSRLKNISAPDLDNLSILVEPGVINLEVSQKANRDGFFFAPDPSSQGACTIGGNVAENSGGPHCLKYGTTVNHVLELGVILAGGREVQLGSPAADPPGYDLCGLFVGSEGTFGIATAVRLKLMKTPPASRTLLAAFPSVRSATESVSQIIAAGMIPAALEMMDRAIIQAVEDSNLRAGYPRDAEAALLVELEGLEVALAVQQARVETICLSHGASQVRTAAGAGERAALWAGRKGAFGACGRLSPNMYLSDTVVPRNRLPDILEAVYQISRRNAIRVANVFHAGDGNLHPILLYDGSDRGETDRMLQACREIVAVCLEAGGSLSGEHGIGLDKRDYMILQFNEQDLEAMSRVKRAFDPAGIFNPSKIIPQRAACSEIGAAGANLPDGVWV